MFKLIRYILRGNSEGKNIKIPISQIKQKFETHQGSITLQKRLELT